MLESLASQHQAELAQQALAAAQDQELLQAQAAELQQVLHCQRLSRCSSLKGQVQAVVGARPAALRWRDAADAYCLASSGACRLQNRARTPAGQ